MSVVTRHRLPRTRQFTERALLRFDQFAYQIVFYMRTLAYSGFALREYRIETLRQIAQMGLGTGALAVIGGTVGIVGFLTVSAGSIITVQGYNALAGVGVEALTGFLSAIFNSRVVIPITSVIGLAATIGAGATAQLGAMRINEEIDAMEVMGIRAVASL